MKKILLSITLIFLSAYSHAGNKQLSMLLETMERTEQNFAIANSQLMRGIKSEKIYDESSIHAAEQLGRFYKSIYNIKKAIETNDKKHLDIVFYDLNLMASIYEGLRNGNPSMKINKIQSEFSMRDLDTLIHLSKSYESKLKSINLNEW